MIRPILFLLAVSGCVAQTAPGGPATAAGNSSQIYRAHLVDEHLAAFSAVCLATDLTANRSKDLAKAAGVGVMLEPALGGETYSNRITVKISANIYNRAIGRRDPEMVFNNFACSVLFSGSWAATVLPDVKARLKAAGFTNLSEFTREASRPAAAYPGEEAVKYTGTASRGSQNFMVILRDYPRGSGQDGNVRITYISGTEVEIRLQ